MKILLGFGAPEAKDFAQLRKYVSRYAEQVFSEYIDLFDGKHGTSKAYAETFTFVERFDKDDYSPRFWLKQGANHRDEDGYEVRDMVYPVWFVDVEPENLPAILQALTDTRLYEHEEVVLSVYDRLGWLEFACYSAAGYATYDLHDFLWFIPYDGNILALVGHAAPEGEG